MFFLEPGIGGCLVQVSWLSVGKLLFTLICVDNLFDFAEHCLFGGAIADQPVLTHNVRSLFDAQGISIHDNGRILPIKGTVFPEKPILLPPRSMPKRSLETAAGREAFFHALAHIEFVAIYLAWDIIYRFRGLPSDFYRDWLRIADEEASHFILIRNHLLTLGTDYGDLPAHGGLWTHAEVTANDVLARLAVVPRCMEARGLDVTPAMIARLNALNDHSGVEILTRIYQDEIGHVERGSYWFNLLAKQRGEEPERCYRELVETYYKGKPKGPFNREVRIIAGFSQKEIDWLEECMHE